MKTLLNLNIILLCLAAGAMAAQAHAFLDHASPRVGSTVTAPSHLEVWMTEELEPAFSKLEVFDAQNREVDAKDAKVAGATMTVSLLVLKAGTYQVRWKAVATDTHRTSGTFKFMVK